MPVLKLYYDQSLDPAVSAGAKALDADLSAMMRDTLGADSRKCQIIMVAAGQVSPFPVYVDLQFRANTARDRDALSRAIQEIARIVTSALNAGVRIRAFAIDPEVLYALDVPVEASG